MATKLPCLVLVWFGRPIEPNRVTLVKVPHVTDPPLDVDELPGWLDARQYRPRGRLGSPPGWFGQVWYSYPTHGFGMCLRSLDWFPADRLRPASS
jgi:hypothetical protein